MENKWVEMSRLIQAGKLTLQDQFELAKTKQYYKSSNKDNVIEALMIIYTAYLKQKHMLQLLTREQFAMDFDSKLRLCHNHIVDNDDEDGSNHASTTSR